MKRRLLIVLLGFGTVFGFTTGFASVSHHWHHRAEHRRAAFEAHVADVCVEAAARAEAPPEDRWQEPPSDYPAWDQRGRYDDADYDRHRRGDRRHDRRHHDRRGPRGGW